jgi:hypothetical protein
MNKQNYIQSAIITALWAVTMVVVFPPEDYAQWFAWVLSVGGMAVASFNYILLIAKVKSGEIKFEDLIPGANMLPR